MDTTADRFLSSALRWICEGYSYDARFLAGTRDGKHPIWEASLTLNPLPAKRDLSFVVRGEQFIAGQEQRDHVSQQVLIGLVTRAAHGNLTVGEHELGLDASLRYYSESTHRDRWLSDLHLQVSGANRGPTAGEVLSAIDDALRSATPPFDGLLDLGSWLGLPAPGGGSDARFTIRVSPPIALLFDKCALSADRLTLIIQAHQSLDLAHVGLAARAGPGDGLSTRKQLASQIHWTGPRNGTRLGTAKIKLKNADGALAMVMLGNATVQRQWILDPAKARNSRFLAVQHFDRDLRMVKRAIMESSDSDDFEKGVAVLLFMLGFAPSLQVERDSPDLVVSTPDGRLAIVECTIRTADFGSKIGKLVDRRGALIKALQGSGHPASVAAVLACRLARDQIAAHEDELRKHKILLVSGDDLASTFQQVRFSRNPDNVLRELERQNRD